MAFVLYLQLFRGLEPCPLCVFQRVAMIATGLVFLAAALHAPRGGGARSLYTILGLASAGGGGAIAARHVWLQSLPPDQVPACGPTLDYLFDIMPLHQVLATVLKGDGNCAIIDARFLGLSLPAWSFVSFVLLALYWLAMPLLSRDEYRHYL